MKRFAWLLVLLLAAPSAGAGTRGGSPVALVTSGNSVLAVSLPSGHVLRRIPVAAGATDVATLAGTSAVASSHAVTVLRGLHVSRVFRFTAPRAVAFAPDGEWLYVTAGDRLTVIELARSRVVARLRVGRGAGRIGVDPLGNQVWVALPHAIVTVDVGDRLPHVSGRLPLAARDLAFTADGRTAWIAEARRVVALDAADCRIVRTVPGGADRLAVEPFSNARHVFLAGRDGTLRTIAIHSGRTVRRVRAASGPFALAVGGGLVAIVAAGELSERTDEGRVLLRMQVPRRARAVAVAVLP